MKNKKYILKELFVFIKMVIIPILVISTLYHYLNYSTRYFEDIFAGILFYILNISFIFLIKEEK